MSVSFPSTADIGNKTSRVVGCLMFLMANRFELERAVRDVEVPAQAFAQPIQHLTRAPLADAGLINNDVRREHRNSAGNRPGVQVMDVDNAAYSQHVLPYFVKVDAARSGLQQHVDDLAQQRPGARNDQHDDAERSDRVERCPAGDQDQYGGNDHGQRTNEVSQDLEVGAAHVQALGLRRTQHQQAGQIGKHTDDGYNEHQAAIDLRGTAQPVDSHDQHPYRYSDQQERVRQSCEH